MGFNSSFKGLNQNEQRKSDEKGRGLARGYCGSHDCHGLYWE